MPERFDEWWNRDGKLFDPDANRKELAEYAYHKASAHSRNYTADDATFPQSVTFENGRRVRIAFPSLPDGWPGREPYLIVEDKV